MQIRSISLQGFRRYDAAGFSLGQNITLLSGNNAAGKTTLLDGVALALGAVLRALGLPGPVFAKRDVHQGAATASVSCRALVRGAEIEWECALEVSGDRARLREGPAGALRALAALTEGEGDLPLLAYRAALPLPQGSRPGAAPSGDARLDAYAGALPLAPGDAAVVARLEAALAAEADPAAEAAVRAVEAALTECVGDSDPVSLSLVDGELWIRVGDGAAEPWRGRGGGFRAVAGLFAELAWRCCALNPHHGADAPGRASGVVLLDGVERDLHPRWQRYILRDLAAVFPGVQLVASTYSPFVIQSLHDGLLLELDGRRVPEYPELSIEDIAEEVMGVRIPQRSQRFLEMYAAAEEYYRVLRAAGDAPDADLPRLKARLDELMLPFSNDPAYHAFLSIQRIASGVDLRDDESE